MRLSAEDPVYEKSLAKANRELGDLRDALIREGFGTDDLKTTDFGIQPVYDSIKDRYDSYKQVFRCFRVEHSLALEFDFDSKRLGRILAAIAASSAVPEFNIGFTVKDKDTLAAQMLQNAVADARMKAEIIANAASLRLGDIISMDYSWDDVHVHSPTRFALMAEKMDYASAEIDIQPDDIKVSDAVTIVWQIAKRED
jgi:hypothetical protein